MQRLADRRVQDALLVAALLAVAVITVFDPAKQVGFAVPGDGDAQPRTWWLAVVVALALPLLARRSAPGWVLTAVGLAFTLRVGLHTGGTAGDLAVPIAVDAVAAYGTRRSLWGLVVLLGGPVLLVVAGATPGGSARDAAGALVLNVALPLCTGWSRRRGRSAEPSPTAAPDAPRPEPAAHLPQLTPREREVLGHVAQGATNAEIARTLGISPETVKTHVQRIVAKLGVPDRTAAAMRAHPAPPRADRTPG